MTTVSGTRSAWNSSPRSAAIELSDFHRTTGHVAPSQMAPNSSNRCPTPGRYVGQAERQRATNRIDTARCAACRSGNLFGCGERGGGRHGPPCNYQPWFVRVHQQLSWSPPSGGPAFEVLGKSALLGYEFMTLSRDDGRTWSAPLQAGLEEGPIACQRSPQWSRSHVSLH